MSQSHYDQSVPLEERLEGEAKRLRARAKTLPVGPLQEEALEKAEQIELGLHITKALRPSVKRTR